MKLNYLVILLFFPLLSISQNFTIDGEFTGSNTDNLILYYFNKNGQFLKDTVQIEKGKFKFTGNIIGTQRVHLKGNSGTNSVQDPNRVDFFLEPGNIQIKLQENNFKEIKVTGSKSQKNYELIEKKTKPIFLELDSISKNRTDNSKKIILAGLDTIQKLELNYVFKYPNSPIVPYLLTTHKRKISIDSLRNLFDKFSNENKESIYGKEIEELINKKIVNANDIAPNFVVKDISGETISLADYKGKYLLIDFWADWCKPCIEKLPEIKSLIKKYRNQSLEVLFVSFDKTEDEWKRNVEKYNIEEWDHTFIGLNNLRNKESISYKYDVQPIPAYILIDQKGKIIERYAAASKSDKDFDDMVNKFKELMK